jgi:hypothetical protein
MDEIPYPKRGQERTQEREIRGKKSRKALYLVFLLLIFAAVAVIGIYFYRHSFGQKSNTNTLQSENVIKILEPPKYTKIPVPEKKLPSSLDGVLVLPSDIRIVDAYDLRNETTGKINDNVAVLESERTPNELIGYFKNSLKGPGFRSVEHPADDTVNKRFLLFMTRTGLLDITIEKIDLRSQVLLKHFSIIKQ